MSLIVEICMFDGQLHQQNLPAVLATLQVHRLCTLVCMCFVSLLCSCKISIRRLQNFDVPKGAEAL